MKQTYNYVSTNPKALYLPKINIFYTNAHIYVNSTELFTDLSSK
jgi:hypothetical protein